MQIRDSNGCFVKIPKAKPRKRDSMGRFVKSGKKTAAKRRR